MDFEIPTTPSITSIQSQHSSRAGSPRLVTPTYGPIEKKMRATLSKLKDSKYTDTFDWSIYDKIAARYGDKQPRGGVVFNTALKLVNHHASCSKCHYSFEVDTYGRGCVHNCVYCYAKEILTRHGYWNEPMPFPVNLAEIRKIFYTVFETDRSSRWREVLEKRVPLRIGSMSDSFMWTDKKFKVSLEFLKILRFYKYPHIIFTRSDLIATQEYVDAMDPALVSIQFSMSGGNEAIVRKLEPGAPSVQRRLEAMKTLTECGFWTTARINPLFPMYPDGYFTDQRSIMERFGSLTEVPKLELFDWSFIQQLKEYKVPSALAGVVRLSRFAIPAMSKELGFDYAKFFKPEHYSRVSDSRYSDSEIAYYYKRIQQECVKADIRFNQCYIGQGIKDYYAYQALWDNKKDCCDARGHVPAFQASSQDVPWEIRAKHAPCKDDAVAAQKAEREMDTEFAAKQPGFTHQSSNRLRLVIQDEAPATLSLAGINIQTPWSQLLVSGEKTIETRKYPLPKRYMGVPLAIIETPGKYKPTFRARIIGVITFSHSIEYKSAKEWAADGYRHRVSKDDPMFRFKTGESKHGWVVKSVTKFAEPICPPAKRGIVFARKCRVPASST